MDDMTFGRYQSSPALAALLAAAKPVLRVHALKDETWKRREGDDPSDFRIGPWRAAGWSILDKETYYAAGEVLYWLVDGAGHVRYVGESKSRLRTRWRTPPLAGSATRGEGIHLFHNRAWPRLEETLLRDPGAGPFSVLVLGVAELGRVVSRHAVIREFVESDVQRLGPKAKHLSWHVETWICEQPVIREHLWNRSKLKRSRFSPCTRRGRFSHCTARA